MPWGLCLAPTSILFVSPLCKHWKGLTISPHRCLFIKAAHGCDCSVPSVHVGLKQLLELYLQTTQGFFCFVGWCISQGSPEEKKPIDRR